MNLTVSRGSGQGLCSLSLHWDLSEVLLVIRVGLWVWGEEAHITSRVPTADMTDDCRC